MKNRSILLGLALCPAALKAINLTGLICGPDEEPVAGLEVTFTTPDERVFTGSTGNDGSFVVELPDKGVDEGILSVDSIRVIEQGFTRPTDFIWNNNLPPAIPVIELEEITPELVFERRPDGTNCLRFTFDWVAGAAPQTLRSYCVDRSTDCLTWNTIMNVGMACPPVEFIDATATEENSCYYRIRPIQSIRIDSLPPEFFGNIGDPAMVPEGFQDLLFPWPNNVVTLNSGVILNDNVPIIAPEIRLVPDPGE